MTDRDEASESLLESLEEAINILEKAKEECSLDDWELLPLEGLEEIIEQLRDMAERLNIEVDKTDDFDQDEDDIE